MFPNYFYLHYGMEGGVVLRKVDIFLYIQTNVLDYQCHTDEFGDNEIQSDMYVDRYWDR